MYAHLVKGVTASMLVTYMIIVITEILDRDPIQLRWTMLRYEYKFGLEMFIKWIFTHIS